jgi:endonuclease YncB( thermonuclease family)
MKLNLIDLLAIKPLKYVAWVSVTLCLGYLPTVVKAQNKSEWTTLRNCTLKEDPGNDGDSFHVISNGKELVIRLYMVDTPETKYEYVERILKQMNYFGSTHYQVIQIGELSKEFTKSFLKRPFTVQTKFENALGSSGSTRIYGFVTGANKKDLGEQLIEQGLARSYGKEPSGTKINPEIRKRYDLLQKNAKNKEIGVWSKTKTPKLSIETSRYITSKSRNSALSKADLTSKNQGHTTQNLIESIKKGGNKNQRTRVEKRTESIFFQESSRPNTSKDRISEEELKALIPIAKDIDFKANSKK